MKKENKVLLLCSIAYIMSLMSRSSPAVLVNYLINDIAFTSQNLSLISAATMISYGFMQLPAGILTDLYGARKVFIALTCIAGFATLGFAFAQSAEQVILARFCIGMGVSLSVVNITLVSLWFNPRVFARANSLLCAASEFGPVLAASPLVLLISLVSWRGAVMIMALIFITLAFFVFFMIPEQAPYAYKQDKSTQEKNTFKKSMQGLWIVLSNIAFLRIVLWQMLATGSIYMMLNLWIVDYYQKTAGYSVLEASFLVSIASIVLIAIQASVGFLSDIVFKSRKKVLILVSMSFLTSGILLVFLAGSSSYFLNLLKAILLLSGVAGSTLCSVMVKESFPSNLTGTALGCFNMLYPLWTAFTQILFAFLLSYSYTQGMDEIQAYKLASSIILCSGVLAFLLSLSIRDTYQNYRK